MQDVYEYGIVGMGPAGIGLAMSLSDTKAIKSTICFERGECTNNSSCSLLQLNKCVCLNSCNIISGIGGASFFSGGKISIYPAGSGLLFFFDSEKDLYDLMKKTRIVLSNSMILDHIHVADDIRQEAAEFYKQRNITYKYYDVYKFNSIKYRNCIYETVKKLKTKGLTLREHTEVFDIQHDPLTNLFHVTTRYKGKCIETYFVQNLFLANGATDIQDALFTKFSSKTDQFYEIGVRVEAPSNYFKSVLSVHGDLKLKTDTCRTYCVVDNGRIIVYKTNGMYFLEGQALPTTKTESTNLAILVKCKNEQKILNFIQTYKNNFYGKPVKQLLNDYLLNQNSKEEIFTTLSMATAKNINKLLPQDINLTLKNFISTVVIDAMHIPTDKITLVAPELKIIRNINLQKDFSLEPHVYVIGAATGKFRGILQSFCSGFRCGQLLLRR